VESTCRGIDQRRRELEDWREGTLGLMRALILEADPEMLEERKWRKPSNSFSRLSSRASTSSSHRGSVGLAARKSTFSR